MAFIGVLNVYCNLVNRRGYENICFYTAYANKKIKEYKKYERLKKQNKYSLAISIFIYVVKYSHSRKEKMI